MTEAEDKLNQITKELENLKTKDRIKSDVAYTHLTSIIKWLIVTIVIIIVTVFGSIAWFLNNFELLAETTEVEQQTDTGDTNYIGNDGDIYNGLPESKEN